MEAQSDEPFDGVQCAAARCFEVADTVAQLGLIAASTRNTDSDHRVLLAAPICNLHAHELDDKYELVYFDSGA